MNSIHPSDSKSSFFPKAEDISENLRIEQLKMINSGKSDLANYILRELTEFRNKGKLVDIDLDKHRSDPNERSQIKRMLYEQGWKVECYIHKTEINQWPFIDGQHDETIHWKIIKQEKSQ
jgi:hypothetical protein